MPTYIGLSMNHKYLNRVNITIRKGAQLILHPLWMLQALPLNSFNHAHLHRVNITIRKGAQLILHPLWML
jgi:virulence-associated protein VagC